MINKRIAVAAVVMVCLWTAAEEGLGAYSGRYTNPVGSGVMPQSTYGGGLVTSPNPVDTSGNLVITGNVRGGRQFQGQVPYNSSTAFYDSLGTTTLDSFMRSSAGAESIGRYRGGSTYQNYMSDQFFSQTGTVTSQRALTPGAYDPSTNRIISRPPSTFGMESSTRRSDAIAQTYDGRTSTSLGPMARSTGELERVISRETSTAPTTVRGLTAEQYEMEIATLRSDLEMLRTRLEPGAADQTRPGQINPMQEDNYLPGNRVGALDDTARAYDRTGLDNMTARTLDQRTQQQDPYNLDREPGQTPEDESIESLMERIDRLLNRTDESATKTETSQAPKSLAQDAGQRVTELMGKPESYLEDSMARSVTIRDRRRPMDPMFTTDETDGKIEEVQELPRKTISSYTDVESMDSRQLSDQARRLMGEHESLEAYSNDKAGQYMKIADQYMSQGRFYRASDSYRLSLVYRPNNPLANAGKSHALFAAGEYMSSVLFLSRTLAAFPDYARAKIDFNTLIGTETVNKQITDIKSRLELINVPELHFMLGYAYYRLGDLKNARVALDTALEQMPKNEAVELISKAVNEAMGKK